MDRKDFIKDVDTLTDRELRKLLNFIYKDYEENEKLDQLEEKVENIKVQRNMS